MASSRTVVPAPTRRTTSSSSAAMATLVVSFLTLLLAALPSPGSSIAAVPPLASSRPAAAAFATAATSRRHGHSSSSSPRTAGGITALSALPIPAASAAASAVSSATAAAAASSNLLTAAGGASGSGVDTTALTQYFLETSISAGVPALFWVLVLGFAGRTIASAARAGSDSGGRSGREYGYGGRSDDPFGGPSAVQDLYDDLYTDGDSKPGQGGGGGGSLFGMAGRFGQKENKPALKNLGIPQRQYLKINRLNTKYESYDYTLTSATQSKAAAASKLRTANFQRALSKSISSSMTELTPAERTDLLRVERELLLVGGELIDEIGSLQRQLTDLVIREEMEGMQVEIGEVDPEVGVYENMAKNESIIVDAVIEDKEEDKDESMSLATTTTTSSGSHSESSKKNIAKIKKTGLKSMLKTRTLTTELKALEKAQTELIKLELAFVRSVIEIMGPDRANAVRVAIMGNEAGGGMAAAGTMLMALKERPLKSVLGGLGYGNGDGADGHGPIDGRTKSLFVTDFPGDVSASQVEDLREEVTAIIRSSQPGDEALVVLQSGGGTVTGYGLAAAQLRRFRTAGMKLTVCVEQVAASGGYMMCCVADKIVASPFAVLGSIGVISDMPNVYERLKKEGVEFQTVTAGKYKRTITPTKKVTQEDLKKSKQDVEDILKLFKGFVHENRPSLDIDEVATGETWFGTDALERKLCDEIRTADDVLVEYVDAGYDVFEVKYDPTPERGSAAGLLDALPLGGTASNDVGGGGVVRGLVRWAVRSIVPALREEFEKEMSEAVRNAGGGLGGGGDDASRRYMMKDDAADRIRVQD